MSEDRYIDPPPPFWLVWNRRGRSPVFEHSSYHSARQEAERLSRLNAGTPFYVLCPVARGGYDREHVCWSHYTSRGEWDEDDFNAEHSPRAAGVE